MAARARALFAEDATLTRRYHELGGGKWNHMMSQTHIGYTYWNQPPRTRCPPSPRCSRRRAEIGVAVEGSECAWPDGRGRLSLPALDPFERAPRYLEVFNRGSEPAPFEITASEPWLTVDTTQGEVTADRRIWVSAKWDEVPAGVDAARSPSQRQHARRDPRAGVDRAAAPAADRGFVETRGVVSIEPSTTRARSRRRAASGGAADHGRTLSGVTPLPVTATSTPRAPRTRMRLEYAARSSRPARSPCRSTLAPTQKFQPGPGCGSRSRSTTRRRRS